MNNKGISTIVATVLIVLITVAAVTILWAAISPLVGSNLEQSTACLNVQSAVKIDPDARYTFAEYDAPGGLSVRVERAANSGDLAGFEIFVEDSGSTLVTFDESEETGATQFSGLNENGALVFIFNDSSFEGLTAQSTPTISIAPQVLIDGEATSCAAGAAIEINVLA
jgi:hypothetical protein